MHRLGFFYYYYYFLVQGESKFGKVDLGFCYVTAALQSLTQQRQLLKYLPLAGEGFCGAS